MDSSKANLVLEKMIKTWDWQTPPLVGEKSHVFPKILFEAPFEKGLMWKAKVESLKEEGTGERSIDKRHLKTHLSVCRLKKVDSHLFCKLKLDRIDVDNSKLYLSKCTNENINTHIHTQPLCITQI